MWLMEAEPSNNSSWTGANLSHGGGGTNQSTANDEFAAMIPAQLALMPRCVVAILVIYCELFWAMLCSHYIAGT
jgi:hypothetical protein